ncbi:hypothetical protein MRX96_016269 [Rhipicephalus microplus]
MPPWLHTADGRSRDGENVSSAARQGLLFRSDDSVHWCVACKLASVLRGASPGTQRVKLFVSRGKRSFASPFPSHPSFHPQPRVELSPLVRKSPSLRNVSRDIAAC